VLAALILAIPFLLRAPRAAPPEAVAWARDWFRAEARGALSLKKRFLADPRGGPTVATWPFFVVSYLGALPALLLVGGLARGLLRPNRAVVLAIVILLLQVFLFAGAL